MLFSYHDFNFSWIVKSLLSARRKIEHEMLFMKAQQSQIYKYSKWG